MSGTGARQVDRERASIVDEVVRRTLAIADPQRAVREQAGVITADLAGVESITLIAVGKAAAGMVRAAMPIFGDRVRAGTVIVPRGASERAGGAGNPGKLPPGVGLVTADHPTPSAASVAAGQRVERLVIDASTTPRRAVVLLISGGASALMAAPREELTLEDVAGVASALMKAGAGIDELNTVRRRLDRLKGGGLLRLAAPAPVFTYAISDVPGDDLRTIGSGPGVMDFTSDADALGVLAARGLLAVSPKARAVLRRAVGDDSDDTPTGANAAGARVLMSNTTVLRALERDLGEIGEVVEVRPGVRGEARDAAWPLVERLREIAAGVKTRTDKLRLVLWGGESTVTVRGGGVGGRNQEFALGAALAAQELARRSGLPLVAPPLLVLSFGTDGVDGVTEAAGAFISDTTATTCRTLGLDPARALDANDSHTLLTALQARGERCLVRTGPTGTNVNDVMLGVVWT